jgi:ankyrin repeat protein
MVIYSTNTYALQQSPLHEAVLHGDKLHVYQLLKNGCPVNGINATGQTALHLAIRFGYKDITKTLLEHGANIFLKNLNGKTPLDLAFRFGTEDWNYCMLQLLIDHSQTPIPFPVVHEIAQAFRQVCMARQVKRETYFRLRKK